MRILITGGAGFVGSHLARSFKEDDSAIQIVVMDNLKRRGSERNVRSFKQLGIEFVHGDIRQKSDFEALSGTFDLMIEAAAEPSVLAGQAGSTDYLVETNLLGTYHCLEFARRQAKRFLFLSTSRVYSIPPLRQILLTDSASRLSIAEKQTLKGVSLQGISEEFRTDQVRSLYGTTKLASEMMVQEYVYAYGLSAIVNRCGVIAGAGQFGKTDQGIFTLWVAHHHFNRPLTYTGFSGTGKQVRDLLHPKDLYTLIKKQFAAFESHSGGIFNIGGGPGVSTSLLEWTALCQKITKNTVAIASEPITSAVDVPLYLSDTQKASAAFGWRPTQSTEQIIEDIYRWVRESGDLPE